MGDVAMGARTGCDRSLVIRLASFLSFGFATFFTFLEAGVFFFDFSAIGWGFGLSGVRYGCSYLD